MTNCGTIALLVLPGALLSMGSCNLSPDAPKTNQCRPHPILPVKSAVDSKGLSSPPQCAVEEDGTVTLTFPEMGCPVEDDSWWTFCTFAANQDLNLFDGAWQGQGVLVADVCVDNFPQSALNLRYRSHSVEKILSLISRDFPDEYAMSGCRTVNLAPADSCYSTGPCGKECPVALAGTDAAPPGDAGTSDAAVGPGGCTDFSRAEIKIVDEWCVKSDAPPTAETVTIKLRSLVYYPKDCACKVDGDCFAPDVCRYDGWPTGAKCLQDGGSCPGVCAP